MVSSGIVTWTFLKIGKEANLLFESVDVLGVDLYQLAGVVKVADIFE
jgi:hypothetical protein